MLVGIVAPADSEAAWLKCLGSYHKSDINTAAFSLSWGARSCKNNQPSDD